MNNHYPEYVSPRDLAADEFFDRVICSHRQRFIGPVCPPEMMFPEQPNPWDMFEALVLFHHEQSKEPAP